MGAKILPNLIGNIEGSTNNQCSTLDNTQIETTAHECPALNTIDASQGAFIGGIGAIPGGIIGGIIGGFLGPEAFKGIYDGIKRLFGFKVKNDESDSGELQELSLKMVV